jgi:sugar O-acyltransferase (sialic acid O-acetyltransferase NeuD family)
MKPLVIFGCGDLGQIAQCYFEEEGGREVVAFAVDSPEASATTVHGKPLISFDTLIRDFPPHACDLFVAIGYSRLNRGRSAVFDRCTALGYTLASFVSPRAFVHSTARMGRNVFIFEDNVVQPWVTLGDDVILWSGNHIGHHSVIEDHCFVASHAVISGRVVIGHHTFVGVNATIVDHVKVGPHNLIGAGALISGDTAEGAVYRPDPLRPSRVPSSRLFR